jgi:aldose 1-epimerase
MKIPLSGTRFDLVHGDYFASIASVGATLRTLRHGERDLIVPFAANEVRPAYRGAILAPWPNRVVDGRYSFAGAKHQLSLTEPQRSHALHGLVAWLDFVAVEQSKERVVLSATIEAQAGYPFRLRLDVSYDLDEAGLHTVVTARNTGQDAAPFGTGPHPYLVAGEGTNNDWTLTLPASQVLTVTADRLLPLSIADVGTQAGGAFDFRAPRVINSTFIDHAFTGLARDAGGMTEVRVVAPSGTGVAMSWDDSCPWVQVHTADQIDLVIDRIGLAVEPMTCPPDAYNSGTHLIVIDPGQSSHASWTITAL